MTERNLIYPGLLTTGMTIIAAFLQNATLPLGLAFLTFLVLLFMLVAVNRRLRAPAAVAGASGRIEELEAYVQKLTADLSASQSALASAQNALKNAGGGDEQAVVQFVRNLQSRGRLLDFLMTDIHTFSDTQVGAAARVVHQGLRSLLNDYFTIAPIAAANEGSMIPVPAESLGQSYKLLQSRGDAVPAEGRLLHRGWQAETLRLPRSQKTESAEERRILAPAEIDVGGDAP